MMPMNWENIKRIFMKWLKQTDAMSKWITAHWAALVFYFAALSVILGWCLYGLSILYPVEELAGRQSEFRQKKLEYEEKLTSLKSKKKLIKRHVSLGNSFLNDDRHLAAKKEFDRAKELDSLNIAAQEGLSKVSVYEDFFDKKNYTPETIRRRIDAILEENKKDPHANALMGHLFLRLENWEKALAHYEMAIASDTKMASAYFGKGWLHQFHGSASDNARQALEMYETAASLSPWNTRYLDNLGGMYVKNKQFDRAIATYEKIMRLDPDFILPYFEIAMPYLCLKKPKMALAYLKDRALAKLNDTEKTDADKNRPPWVFRLETKTIYVSTIAQKKYYALALIAKITANDKKQTDAALWANKAAIQAKKISPLKKKALDALALADMSRATK